MCILDTSGSEQQQMEDSCEIHGPIYGETLLINSSEFLFSIVNLLHKRKYVILLCRL